jgi:hypothetical protein
MQRVQPANRQETRILGQITGTEKDNLGFKWFRAQEKLTIIVTCFFVLFSFPKTSHVIQVGMSKQRSTDV